MKPAKNIFIFLTAFTVLLSACRKEKPIVQIPAIATPVNDTMVWIVFDTGSYWIYQTNVGFDTVVVTKTEKKNAQYIDGETGYNYDYYVTTFKNTTRHFEYKAYYYLNRAKFACTEPKLVQTGQEFFFSNIRVGVNMEQNTHCCYVEGREFYKVYNGFAYNTVCEMKIASPCQWDKNLFPQGAYYDFNWEAGLLQFDFYGALGFLPTSRYTIKTYHVNHTQP